MVHLAIYKIQPLCYFDISVNFKQSTRQATKHITMNFNIKFYKNSLSHSVTAPSRGSLLDCKLPATSGRAGACSRRRIILPAAHLIRRQGDTFSSRRRRSVAKCSHFDRLSPGHSVTAYGNRRLIVRGSRLDYILYAMSKSNLIFQDTAH